MKNKDCMNHSGSRDGRKKLMSSKYVLTEELVRFPKVRTESEIP